MTEQIIIQDKLVLLKSLAPAGFALAFHVRFTAPTFLFQTYDKTWLDYYSQNGLVMSDPTVAWGFENRGLQDWADLKSEDAAGVLDAAGNHGLKFGVTCSVGSEDTPSISSFARGDRPFTDDEKTQLEALVLELHELTDNIKLLSPETADVLRKLSIEYTHPSGT